jgi:iron complex outermembrane receptor protein
LHGSTEATLSTNERYVNAILSQKEGAWYYKLELNSMKQEQFNISKKFDYTTLQPNSKRVNSDKIQQDGSLKIGYNINNNSDIAFKISRLKSEYGLPVEVSEAFSWDKYSRVDDKQLNSYWFYYDYKNDTLHLSLRAYYDEYTDLWNIYNASNFSTLAWSPSTFYDSRLGALTSLGFNYSQMQEGTLTLEVDRNRHRQDVENNPVVKDYEAVDSSLSYMHTFKATKDLKFGASAKYKYQDLTQAHSFNATAENYKNNEALDLQLTTDYIANQELSFYGSVARKNRFASLNELYPFFPWDIQNTALKPEKSNSFEAGTSLKYIADTVLNLSAFYNSIEDMIIYENSSNKNIAKATMKGSELKINNYSFQNHDLELSYAYIDAKDANGDNISNIPSSKLYLQDSMNLGAKTKFLLTYLYVDERDSIYNYSTYRLESYSLVDAQLSYAQSKSLLFKFGVKNLLDENWEYSHGQPACGRSIFANLSYSY